MGQNINPRIDLVFKKIFGVEENKDLLISLINSIVSEADQVAEITLLNPYTVVNFYKDKLSILDIKATSKNGQYFNIEIQIADEDDYAKRALFYWAKLYTEQLHEGRQYSELCKVISIHIMNFISIPDSESYHHVFGITEKTKGFSYYQDLELHTIELKKFEGATCKKLSDLASKITTALDVWVAFLTRHQLFDKSTLTNALPQKEHLNKALRVLEVMNFNDEERDTYEAKIKWLMVEDGALNTAERKGIEKGKQLGIKEGKQLGIKEGKQLGIKEGKQLGIEEGKQLAIMQFAKNLLQSGMDIHLIVSLTGLTINQIKTLR